MNPFYKNLSLWLVIVLMMIMLYNIFNNQQLSSNEVAYSSFLDMVAGEQISGVEIQGRELTVTDTKGDKFKVYAPADSDLVKTLRDRRVAITAKPPAETSWFLNALLSWFPMILLIGVWIFFMRQMQGGGGKAMSFGKSRARLLSESAERVTFADVAGIDEP